MDQAIMANARAMEKWMDLHPEGDPPTLSAIDTIVIESRLRALQDVVKYSKETQAALIPVTEAVITDYVSALAKTDKDLEHEKTRKALVDMYMKSFDPSRISAVPVPSRYELKRAAREAKQVQQAKGEGPSPSEQDTDKLQKFIDAQVLTTGMNQGIQAVIDSLNTPELGKPYFMKVILNDMRESTEKAIPKAAGGLERVSRRWGIDVGKLEVGGPD